MMILIRGVGSTISAVFRRIVPDPFVLAVLLTVLVVVIALVWGRYPTDVTGIGDRTAFLLDHWRSGSGLWKLLAFAMQMCLILLGGHVLADTAPVRKLLSSVASIPRSGPSAAALVGLTAMILGLLNWGLGLIGGAVLAREAGRSLQKRGIPAHYPLLAAAGYMGLLVWHGGFSGSAPLSMTTHAGATKVLPEGIAAQAGVIGLDHSILSPLNMIVSGGLLVIVPVLLWALSPRTSHGETVSTIDDHLPAEDDTATPADIESVPDWFNRSRFVTTLLGLALAVAAVRSTWVEGIDTLGLDEVIMYLLAAALLLHHSPESFTQSAARAAAGCAGIMVQFPLYAGIMGIMVAAGLIEQLTGWMLELAGPRTIELFTLISAGIVNILVPSGGGQWAVQGPIALEVARESGIPPGRMLMAVAYGDELTNMLQPFWALPLLAITGVRARDIVGYTAIIMLVALAWMGLWLVLT